MLIAVTTAAMLDLRKKGHVHLIGLKAEGAVPEGGHGHISAVSANVETRIRIFGSDLTNNTLIAVTPGSETCGNVNEMTLDAVDGEGLMATARVTLPSEDAKFWYVCVKDSNTDANWTHQGTGEGCYITTSLVINCITKTRG